MKLHRINALLFRHLYLYKRSVPRLMDIFFWPVVELILWGFISLYLGRFNMNGVNIVTVLLGAIIFWDILSQSQRAVSVAFLEDVWERNLLNIFVSPLTISEFVVATVLLGWVRVMMVGVVMGILASALYHLNIFQFGFSLIPFVMNLLLFGWSAGLFATAIILRYGTAAQVLAFSLLFLVQPLSAVFYPVSILPIGAQWIAMLLPSTHVFEGMRAVIATGKVPYANLGWAFLTNAICLFLSIVYFSHMFARVKEEGRLIKLD